MKRRWLAVIASGTQSIVVLLALLLTATDFDASELRALVLCWPAFCAIEYLRASPGLATHARFVRLAQSVFSVLLVVTVGFFTMAATQYRTLAQKMRAVSAPDVLIQYEDINGRTNRARIPRNPGETAEAHRDRAKETMRLYEQAFPRKDS